MNKSYKTADINKGFDFLCQSNCTHTDKINNIQKE